MTYVVKARHKWYGDLQGWLADGKKMKKPHINRYCQACQDYTFHSAEHECLACRDAR